MTTKERADQIIGELNTMYQNGRNGGSLTRPDDNEEWGNLNDAVDYLEQKGLIRANRALGFIDISLLPDGIDFIENGGKVLATPNTTTYNIQNSGNAIIGSQENATINAGVSLSEIETLMQAMSEEEQPLMHELLEHLKKIETGAEPVKSGTLAKFSNILAKHTPLISAIGGWLMRFVMQQPK